MKHCLTIILLFVTTCLVAQQIDLAPVPSGMRNTAPLTVQDELAFGTIREIVLPENYRGRLLPDSIDNSTYKWLRPIFSQEVYPNCMQSTSIAYNFTYEINRLRDLPGDDPDNQYTTHFAWNFFNGGNGWYGANYLFTMDVLKHHGTPNVTDYGGMYYGGGERWMSGYDKWYNAMNNRISGIRKIYVGDADGLLTLKHWLHSHLDGSETGGVASFIACSPWNMTTLPEGTPNAGKKVVISWCPEALHGMTIVGYNDSVRYDYNQDGIFTNDIDINGDGQVDMRDWEIGALKFCNSYGDTWADSGFCYMMYRTLADPIEEGGIWANTVHVVDAKPAHDTRMACKVSMTHNYRERIRVRTGISTDLNADKPEFIQSYTIFNYQGDWHYMQGNDTTPDHMTIEFGLDLNPLLSYVNPGEACKFFLIVDEKDPENYGYGQVNHFSLMDYTNGLTEVECEQQNVPLVENGRTSLSITHVPDFDDVEVVTAELPVYAPGQPLEVQLEAEGGSPPYQWHLNKNYRMGEGNAPFPLINGSKIIVNSYEDSLAKQALEFSFPFYGNEFDTVVVSSSGYLRFDANMYFWSYLSDLAYFLKNNRVVAPLLCTDMVVYDDFGHGVWYEGDASKATFRWRTSFDNNPAGSDINFSVTLYPNGNIDFWYGQTAVDRRMRWVSGISDGDLVNYSLPELPDPGLINENTRVSFLSATMPDEIGLSDGGMLTLLENAGSMNTDVSVVVTDNTLLRAEKTFQLTDGLAFSISLQGSDIYNGQMNYFDLHALNRGTDVLQDIDLTLSTSLPGFQIIDGQQSLSSLQPGESIELTGVFSCLNDEPLADGELAVFSIKASTAQKAYERDFVFTVATPEVELFSYSVQNENGILEPGNPADLNIKLINNGSRESINTSLRLIPSEPGVVVNNEQPLAIGTIRPGETASNDFSLTPDDSFMLGTEVGFTLEVRDELGTFKELPFSLRIGKVPVCIVDMDPGTISGPYIHELLQQMDVQVEYMRTFPISFKAYQSVILCLGKIFANYELSYQQGVALEQYLNDGGRLYMEGRVIWQQQPPLAIFGKFNIGTVSSPGVYETLDGIDGTFTQGLSYANTAVQPYCFFYLEPVPPAYAIFTGRAYPNVAAVAYDAGTYKTIGTIFELGTLASSDTCQVETFMQAVLDFFDVKQSVIGIAEGLAMNNRADLYNYPNPFSYSTSIPLVLDKRSFVEAAVYDLQGRMVGELLSPAYLPAGTHELKWEASGTGGKPAPAGIYIFRVRIDGLQQAGKMVLMRQ
jgi:hypothetical protein